MQTLGKLNFNHPKWNRKIFDFSISNKLSVIGSFQFLNFLSNSLVKNSDKDDFKYFSQEFDKSVLYLVKRNVFMVMNI